MTTLFFSDVHLSAARPALVEAFFALLEGPARDADSVFILGDLFDRWLGDDDRRAPHDAIIEALAALTASGVATSVMHGNHDFLLGTRFESETGCRVLAEPHVLELDGQRLVLLHGDSLCTRDVEYQAFRRHARDPENQRAFLSLPMAEREARAAALSQTSREKTRLKPADIMDVTPDEVDALLTTTGARAMVHGHTHRPAVHEHSVDGRKATRYVLADWYEHGSFLRFDAGRFESLPVQPDRG